MKSIDEGRLSMHREPLLPVVGEIIFKAKPTRLEDASRFQRVIIYQFVQWAHRLHHAAKELSSHTMQILYNNIHYTLNHIIVFIICHSSFNYLAFLRREIFAQRHSENPRNIRKNMF